MRCISNCVSVKVPNRCLLLVVISAIRCHTLCLALHPLFNLQINSLNLFWVICAIFCLYCQRIIIQIGNKKDNILALKSNSCECPLLNTSIVDGINLVTVFQTWFGRLSLKSKMRFPDLKYGYLFGDLIPLASGVAVYCNIKQTHCDTPVINLSNNQLCLYYIAHETMVRH